MSVMRYTGEQQHTAIKNTKGIWTTAFAMQKLATPYCPFCESIALESYAKRGKMCWLYAPRTKISRVAAAVWCSTRVGVGRIAGVVV